MSATTITPPRAVHRPGRSLVWRVGLVALAAVVAGVGAPAWVRMPVEVAAALVVVLFCAARLGGRTLPAVLVATGGALVTLILTGFALNLLPSGLTTVSWAIGIGVVEAAALGIAARRSPLAPLAPRHLRVPLAPALWTLAIVVVLGGSVAWAAGSFTATHAEPVALAAEARGSGVLLTVDGSTARGPLELDLVTADGRTVLSRHVRVAAGSTWTRGIAAPRERALVQLREPGAADPLRELVLDPADLGGTR